jgi:hypothetical protein
MDTTATINRLRGTGFSMQLLVEKIERDRQYCIDFINGPKGAAIEGIKNIKLPALGTKGRLMRIALDVTDEQAKLIFQLLEGCDQRCC